MKIGKNKNGYYYTTITVPNINKKQRKYIYGSSPKEVKLKYAKLIQDIENNNFIPDSKMTLEKYLNNWFKSHKSNLSLNTARGYQVNIDNHILPLIGDIKLGKLAPININKAYEKLYKTLGENSVKYVHRTLSKALNDAVKMQLIIRNPCDAITLKKAKKVKPAALNKKQVLYFLETLSEYPFELTAHLAVALGMRRSEILGLTWDKVKDKYIIVDKQLIYENKQFIIDDVKSDASSRIVVLPEGLKTIITKHKEQQEKYKKFFGIKYTGEYVVCYNNGDPFVPGNFSKLFGRKLKNAGLNTTLHGLRHTFGSLHGQNNTSLKSLSVSMGHANLQITQHYQQELTEMMEEVAAATDKILYNI